MGCFHSLNEVFPFACSQLLWNTSEWNLLKYLWSGCWRSPKSVVWGVTCSWELQYLAAQHLCPGARWGRRTFLLNGPRISSSSFVMSLTTQSSQEATNLFTRTILKVAKLTIATCLTIFPVFMHCRYSFAQLSFLLIHILDYLNSLALICLCILFSLLLLRYLCNCHYQQDFTFGHPKVRCPVLLWRFPPAMPSVTLTDCTRNLQDPF